jgi:hypothetical protein
MSRSFFSRPRASLALALSVIVAMALSVSSASAGPGYRLDSVKPTISLGAEVPVGVAIDQSSQAIYVAEASRNLFNIQPGQIEQLSSSGVPTASSPFGTGGQDFFVSVAVNPVTQGIYAYQIEGSTPQGQKGASKVSVFSSSGALGTSFFPANAQAASLAADSSGRLLFPNSATGSVQIYSPSGTLEGAVTCGSCPGGSFITPQSVALNSAGKLYVVDSANGGRVLKFSPSGGSYVYESTLQSGAGAVAVGVDSSSDDVFVGTLTSGTYHVVAYDSSGVAFDDFAAGMATKSAIDVISGQLAVNATTHKVYLSNPGGNNLRVFERVASIPAPTATIAAPTPVGQVEATLRATVNPKGHVLTSCAFQYTDHADFLANGYADAETAPCPAVVGDEESVLISAKVKGLDADTGYDYRIQIESYGGADESASQSFQTLPPVAPEATTGAASAVTKTTATLGGTVNPKGGTISNCHFEYVTEAGFQSNGFTGAPSKVCSTTPSGNFATSVSAKITGLGAGTSYRFRVVATNNSGTTQALDKTFATVAETCAENPAFCPPPVTPPAPASPAPAAPGPVVAPPPPAPRAKPLKCRRGFKKKRVRGKLKCVRIKKRRARR